MSDTRTSYRHFLARKGVSVKASGLQDIPDLHPALFPFQRDVVNFSLRIGRGALFLDTGLGKTICQLEWARHLSGKVLILAPLAVASQTVREGQEKLGLDIYHSRDGSVREKITIANYERLHLFDPSEFSAIVLDESSILKSFTGKTKQQLCHTFNETPYRLACTATPAPNDYMELGNHCEFLSQMERLDMLQRYFVHDSANTADWRLKGHAEKPFWKWVASWAACMSKPSDLGYDDGAFRLPSLNIKTHIVASDLMSSDQEGYLFHAPEMSATSMHREKRFSFKTRTAALAELVNADSETWIVWCETNDESAAFTKSIKGAIEVKGSMSIDEKELRLEAFSCGRERVIVTKPSIAGFGLNWQHCCNVAFGSISYSYEQFYQAIRRSWRFGQKRAVNAHVFLAGAEMPLWHSLQSKLEAHEIMKSAMRHATFSRGTEQKTQTIYTPTHQATLPAWINS